MLRIVLRHEAADHHRKRSQEDDHYPKSPVKGEHEDDGHKDGNNSIEYGGKSAEQSILNVLDIVDEPLNKIAFRGSVDLSDRRMHIRFEKLFPHLGDDLLSDESSLTLKKTSEDGSNYESGDEKQEEEVTNKVGAADLETSPMLTGLHR